MATIYWAPTKTAVAQVGTLTISGFHASTVYTIDVGGITIVSQQGVSDAFTTGTRMVTAWNDSTHPYTTGITASGDTVMTFTGTAGIPFTLTTTDTGGSGTIGSYAAVTACDGPNFFGTGDNWYNPSAGTYGTAPTGGDTLIIGDSDINICWGLDQNSITMALITILATYTGRIGLDYTAVAITNPNGETVDESAREYRDLYLKIGSTLLDIGQRSVSGSPAGSKRMMINTHTAASTVTVYSTASSSADTGRPSCRLLCNSASTVIRVREAQGGGVGLAAEEPNESLVAATLFVEDTSSGNVVSAGPGAAITNWHQRGGTNKYFRTSGTITEVNVRNGTLLLEGGAACTNLKSYGGVVSANMSGTIATLTLDGGTVDFSESTEDRAVTTLNMLDTGKIIYDPADITIGTITSVNPAVLEAS